VGDRLTDVEAARAAGCRPVLVRTGSRPLDGAPPGVPQFRDLRAFAEALLAGSVEEGAAEGRAGGGAGPMTTMSLDARALVRAQVDDHLRAAEAVVGLADAIEAVAREMAACLAAGRTICWLGNGGSAADSQHMATEFVGRFRRPRGGLPSLALTTDSSALTAIGNDFGFDEIFARQVEALCRPGDVVVGISTSGQSPNVLAAMRRANELGARTVALAGRDGGPLAALCDHALVVPADDTQRIQEVHELIGHILCDLVEGLVVEGGA